MRIDWKEDITRFSRQYWGQPIAPCHEMGSGLASLHFSLDYSAGSCRMKSQVPAYKTL